MEIKGRKKTIPQYYRVQKAATVESLPILEPQQPFLLAATSFNGMEMSPYSPFIPLQYVWGKWTEEPELPEVKTNGDWMKAVFPSLDANKPENVKKACDRWNTYKRKNLVFGGYNSRGDHLSVMEGVKSFIRENFTTDYLAAFYNNEYRNILRHKENLIHLFKGTRPYPYCTNRFLMRSYNGYCSQLNISLQENGTDIPYIQAVVLPENYLYQKWHILVKGSLDLNRVIILVDKELDNPSFPIRAFRTLYKTELEPYLKTLSCQVWKVPVSFIKENCFLPKFKLTGSITQRKQQIEELIQGFYAKYGWIPQERVETTDRIENVVNSYIMGVDPFFTVGNAQATVVSNILGPLTNTRNTTNELIADMQQLSRLVGRSVGVSEERQVAEELPQPTLQDFIPERLEYRSRMPLTPDRPIPSGIGEYPGRMINVSADGFTLWDEAVQAMSPLDAMRNQMLEVIPSPEE